MSEIAKQARKKKTTGDIRVAEQRRTILQLRTAGYTFEEIAREIGYSEKSGAHKEYYKALKDIYREPAEEARALELHRLDKLLQRLWPEDDEDLELDVVDRILKIIERRSKLQGLDTVKTEGSMTHLHVHKHDHWHTVMNQVRADPESLDLFLRLAKRLTNGNGQK